MTFHRYEAIVETDKQSKEDVRPGKVKMEKEINVAFIGCGGICGPHLRSMKRIEGVKVKVFCDPDTARARTRAGEYGIGEPETETDYKAVLKREDIDSVHILTPHHMHVPMIREALAAGKHVICEKPLAIVKKDARDLMEETEGMPLGLVFQNRYNPATKEALRIIRSGEMGRIIGMKADVCWNRGKAYYDSDRWRGLWEESGGGSLINQAIHTIDLMHYLGGPFASVKGSITRDINAEFAQVEDNSHAVFKFQNGMIGLIHTSNDFVDDFPTLLFIKMEKGMLELRGNSLWRMDGDRMEVLVKAQAVDNGGKAVYGNSHEAMLRDFYDSMRKKQHFWLDAKEAYPAIWAVLSIYESSLTGRWVDFS